MRQSAIDCSCGEEDFRRVTHVFVENKASEQASKFLKSPNTCRLVSYGSNVVASCRKDLIPEVEAFVNGQEKFHRCFEPMAIYELNKILQKAGARVAWMHSFYLPDPDYVPEWSNALSSPAKKHLDMLGYGAYDGDKLIGLAGCSDDCVEMWQIGIDVLPEYRRKGVASALTNRLARAIFEHGKIPLYAAAWSNVRSIRNGMKSGFRPAWAALESEIINTEN